MTYFLKCFRVAAAILLFASCSVKEDDIRLDNLNGVEVEGITLSQARVIVRMALSNDSGVRLTVREANLTVRDDRGEIAEVFLDERLVLPRKSSVEVALPLVLRFKGALGSAGAIPRLAAVDRLRIDGDLRLKGGSLNKKWRVRDMPLEDFLHMIGISDVDSLSLSL